MFSEYADKYLKQGFSIFPAKSDKKPAIPAWASYQTRIPSTKEIEAWSRDLGDMNIAVICGQLSNLNVVDCDTPPAIQEVEALLPEGMELPVVTTPRGGRHYYFQYCPELHSRNGVGDGIDVKSEGGYVLAPPSKTENGVYTWNSEMNLDTIPERPPVPDALLALLKAGTSPVLPSPDKPILTQGTRDNYLYHTALQLLKDGRPRDEVERIIVDMAKICTPPFPEKEARIKVESAWNHYSEKNPQAACLVRPAFTGTLADFFKADIPEAEVLIEGLLAREEFMFMGGVKHAHKTTAMMDLGLHYASGHKAWLTFLIPKPGRFLMIQQELGEYEFRKRLRKAVDAGHFKLDNFFPYTGTGEPIKIIEDKGFKRLCQLCDRVAPLDILGLDPLHTFHTSNENAYEMLALIRDRINYLKITYNCAVITTHHFSSKRPQNDPEAPTEAGGWFRGHSVLADSADVLFCLHRLPGQKDNPKLRLAYEDYNVVEITLRNGKWPPRFAIEFNEQTFLMNVSDVWHELGAKIEFGKIREVCDMHGGSILRTSLVIYFQNRLDGISESTVRRAIMREEEAGKVTTRPMPGRGHPTIVESRRNL